MKREKRSIKLLACGLSLLVAAGSTVPIHGAEERAAAPASKDETVYVMAKEDGSTDKIIVSEWLKNMGQRSLLKDYTELKKIENVKGEEAFDAEKGDGTWKAAGNDIYYQGEIDKELPVDMRIQYKLDGETVSAKELAGKSGDVEIRFDYTNNQRQGNVYVPFVLLTSLALDNEIFTDVEVTNGKVINDGQKSLVVGYAMPGLEESLNLNKGDVDIPDHVVVTCQAKKFALDGTMTVATSSLLDDLDVGSINSLDDLNAAMDKLESAASKLQDGSAQLKTGSSQLSKGTGTLYHGTKTLKEKVAQLGSGLKAAKDGTAQLKNGAGELKTGAGSLETGASKLAAGAGGLETGAGKLETGAKALQKGLTEVGSGVDSAAGGLDKTVAGDKAVLAGLEKLQASGQQLGLNEQQMAALNGAIGELKAGLNQTIAGQEAVAQGLRAGKAGLSELENGAGSLVSGTAELKSGSSELKNGAVKLKGGSSELKNGLNTLAGGAEDLHTGITAACQGAGLLEKGAGDLRDGAQKVNKGAGDLANGARDLASGVAQFKSDGIDKLVDAFDGSVSQVSDRLKELQDAAADYQSFAGKKAETKGTVKFIYKTDEI